MHDIHALVLFDGGCGLCQRSIRFVAAHDRDAYFRFAPLGGPTAVRSGVAGAAAGQASPTLILVEEGQIYTRSAAALRMAARLDWPWRLLSCLRFVPRFLRDGVYDVVAGHRYAWFGTADACGVPPAALRERLLE